MVPRDTSSDARRVQLNALRRLGGETRLLMACQMADEARALSEAGIRARHPDWTDAEVRGELLILLLGRDLAAKVLEASLAPNGSHVTSRAS
jgi:hypothetical protein